MFSGTAQVSHQGFQVFLKINSVCLLVRVTVVDKNKAVVCCLLATSAMMLSEKKKRNRKGDDLYASSSAMVSYLCIHFGKLSALRLFHRGVGR
jgi:hypothetical protein